MKVRMIFALGLLFASLLASCSHLRPPVDGDKALINDFPRSVVLIEKLKPDFLAMMQSCKIIDVNDIDKSNIEWNMNSGKCDKMYLPIGEIVWSGEYYIKAIRFTSLAGETVVYSVMIIPHDRLMRREVILDGREMYSDEIDLSSFKPRT